jgi:replicative DNA helicase
MDKVQQVAPSVNESDGWKCTNDEGLPDFLFDLEYSTAEQVRAAVMALPTYEQRERAYGVIKSDRWGGPDWIGSPPPKPGSLEEAMELVRRAKTSEELRERVLALPRWQDQHSFYRQITEYGYNWRGPKWTGDPPPGWKESQAREKAEREERIESIIKESQKVYAEHEIARRLKLGLDAPPWIAPLVKALGRPAGGSGTWDGDGIDPQEFHLDFIDSAALDDLELKRSWLIPGILVERQPCVIGGPVKSLKTSIAVAAAVAMSSGTAFLGEFQCTRKLRVGVISGESGHAAIKDIARRVCGSIGIELRECNIHWSFNLPKLANAEHLAELQKQIRLRRLDVVIIDPLYLSLLAAKEAAGLNAGNLYQMGPLLLAAAKICLAEGCTPIICHHFKHTRERYGKPTLEDLAFAGIREFARQWVLLAPRDEYDPETGCSKLWMQAGGSMGQGLARALTITEGKLLLDFSGRYWQVEMDTLAGVRQTAAEDRQTAKDRNKEEAARQDDDAFIKSVDELARDQDAEPAGWVGFKRAWQTAGLTEARGERCFRRFKDKGILEDGQRKLPTNNGGWTKARCVRRKRTDELPLA